MAILRLAAFALSICFFAFGPAAGRAEAQVLVLVDKGSQTMTVQVEGRTRYVWEVSTGRAGYGTPSGAFRPQWMARTYFSKKYYDSPMPYSIFFYHGYAIHGTESIHRLGGPASHGCVRLHPRNAATLFALVQRYGMGGTRILIEDSVAGGRTHRRSQITPKEDPAIAAMADRLMLQEQIERQRALREMAQRRANDAVRRMSSRNGGGLNRDDGPQIAIGVQAANGVAPKGLTVLPPRRSPPTANRPAKRHATPTPPRRLGASGHPSRPDYASRL